MSSSLILCIGRHILEEEAERKDDGEVSEGGKERSGAFVFLILLIVTYPAADDKDTVESTETNMTEEEYFERRVDKKVPGDEDGIVVPADEVALLYNGDKSTNVETPLRTSVETIEPTEDPLVTPLDSAAVSAVPGETVYKSVERKVTEDGLTTLHEKYETSSGDTEYPTDGPVFDDDEAIDLSTGDLTPAASMQRAAEQAAEAQALAARSAEISGEVVEGISNGEDFDDEGYSDPVTDAKVALAERVVEEKEAALAQAHAEAVQADLDAESVRLVDDIDAIADRAVADSLLGT